MSIETAIFDHLTDDAGVAALVGTRVYPLVAPQTAARPYIIYQRISTPRVRSQSGPSGLAHPRFQISGLADSYSGVRALAEAIRTALDGFSGQMGDGNLRVDVFLDNERDSYLDAIPVYLVQMDFIFWHAE